MEPETPTHNVTIVVKPEGVPESRRRETTARDVLLRFGSLLPARLLCFFDEEDCLVLKSENVGYGKANRGVSGPITKLHDFYDWPLALINCIYPARSLGENKAAFDFVIYIHNSTCEDPVGLIMTFAHELQHFVQWATMPAAWEANQRFKKRLSESNTGFDNHDLPIERDARIVAKRISIQLLGADAINQYIRKNIADPLNDLDGRNWHLINGLDVSKPYDVEVETMMFDDELKRRSLPSKSLTMGSHY